MRSKISKIMFTALVALSGFAVMAVGKLLAAQAQQAISNKYILTQATCISPQAPPSGLSDQCQPQTVPVGATIWIQLSGNPSVWAVDAANSQMENLKPVNPKPTYIASPDRIPGTNGIYQFEFVALGKGTATIRMKETQPFLTAKPPDVWTPTGYFTYTITVE